MSWFKRQNKQNGPEFITIYGVAEDSRLTVANPDPKLLDALRWLQSEIDEGARCKCKRDELARVASAAGERIRKQDAEIEGLTHRNRELEENAGLFREDLEKTSRLYQGARREIDALKAEIDRLNDKIDELEAEVAEGERQGDLVSAVAEIAFELREENEALKAKLAGALEKTCSCKTKKAKAK